MAPPTRNRKTASKREMWRELRQQRQAREPSAGDPPAAAPSAATGGSVREPWAPSAYTAFKVILSARLCAAIWNNIRDCDETFNYWEPTHYLLYGTGLQTWEYSPQYALRSYGYLLLHALPARLYSALLQSNRLLVFYFLRCCLAVGCALCEVYFYRGVCRELGARVGRLTLGFLVLSAGMFIASSAFLPSSFSMCAAMLALGAWFRGAFPPAVFATAVSALVGWPFAALLGAPLAADLALRRRRAGTLLGWSLAALFVLLAPLVAVDSDHYGKLVLAPLNIVLYNVVSGGGPELYGTEPLSYYVINCLLNFNIAAPLSLLALPASWAAGRWAGPPRRTQLPVWLALLPLYLWLAVFGWQAHKEERFLFPAYPLVCLAAAVCLDALHRLLERLAGAGPAGWLPLLCLALYGAAGLSRVVGQYRAFHAPLDTFMELGRVAAERMPRPDQNVTVCMGKEWHRFPSSFFLPELSWRLGLLRSEFRGQLPQYFADAANATRLERANFNADNREEEDRYVPETQCHFIVDADTAVTPRQPAYSRQRGRWTVLHTTPFLDAERSSRLLRAFYVPFLTEMHCRYVDYNLLVSNAWRDKLLRPETETVT